jgi:Zn-dependent metalloprotease
MVDKIVKAGETKRSLFEGSINTKFNAELFRKKRAVLTEMSGKQMKAVLTTAVGNMVQAMAPAKKAAKAKTKAGKIVKTTPTPNRMVYDAQNTNDQKALPGKLMRKEGQKATTDKDVNNIYDNCGYVWNFYFDEFKRNSVDDKGLPLINSVHFGTNFGNAFWEGTQMVYGDGDQVFKSFTTDIDITGHELTHGVVQYEASFEYVAQSGAINESMADVFGIMVRQFALGEDAGTSDWLIGRTCMKGTGYALRSMKAPGTAFKNHPILGDDPQPGHMKDYANLPNTRNGDYGGVHINSGITNHAFYLAAVELGGKPWLGAGKIWYEALCDDTLLNSTSQFADLANATTVKAGTLFGAGSAQEKAVKKAWKAVGL